MNFIQIEISSRDKFDFQRQVTLNLKKIIDILPCYFDFENLMSGKNWSGKNFLPNLMSGKKNLI